MRQFWQLQPYDAKHDKLIKILTTPPLFLLFQRCARFGRSVVVGLGKEAP